MEIERSSASARMLARAQSSKAHQMQTMEMTFTNAQKAETSTFWRSLEYIKYIFATLLSLTAFTYIFYFIGAGEAVLPGSPVVHFIILACMMILLAYLEGIQLAILALENEDLSAYKLSHPRAYAVHSLVTTGYNLQRFLVGRQFYVVFVVFLTSQVTTFPAVTRPEEFPEVLWFALINTGLPGALLVLAWGQLMPQLIAAQHPIVFCNLPGTVTVLRITLILESLGITHFAWVLTAIVSKIFGLSTTSSSSTGDAPESSTRTHEVHDDSNSLLRRLADIQGGWRQVMEGAHPFKLLAADDAGADASNELLVAPAMGRAGLEASGPAEGHSFTSTPSPDVYPQPKDIVEHLVSSNQEVPRFLLPPGHPLHVPPHIVAYSLMQNIVDGKQKK